MNMNQNETSDFGIRISEFGIKDNGAANPQSEIRNPHCSRSAFTLTELLVVITIIGILGSLITAAAVNALARAQQTRITLEIQQLSNAMEEFKNEYGAYPPNGMQNSGYLGADDDLVRMFRKAFPRHNEPDILIRGLAGGLNNGGAAPNALPGGMNGAEAIVFWLGGFSKDPQYPLTGPGGPSYIAANGLAGEDLEGRNRDYEFDLGRLGPRDAGGAFDASANAGRFITYQDPRDGTTLRRINMWYYIPDGSQQPLGYFDASRRRAQVANPSGAFVNNYDPWFSQTSAPSSLFLYAVKRPNETNPARTEFASQGKFQILHAGIDDEWGDFSVFSGSNPIRFPEGPFTGEIADTLTNFTTGTLEDEQE